jgi:predicted Rossmann fold flavoprotein
MDVVIVGAGAAGYFAALSAKRHHPGASVTLLERSDKVLSKVRISGGGRCNVTHHCLDTRRLSRYYPRGGSFLRQAFKQFAVPDTIAWFQAVGVPLKVETDGRMFPTTDDSATVVEALTATAHHAGVRLQLHSRVDRLERESGNRWRVHVSGREALAADKVIVTMGGHPKPAAYALLEALGQPLVEPVPSLFTFNLPDDAISELAGVVAPNVRARIAGTDLESDGPLLITHWGMSGPAILRLSAWGARTVHDLDHRFTLQLNWVGGRHEGLVQQAIQEQVAMHPNKQLANLPLFGLPRRLWVHLLHRADTGMDRTPATLPRKERNRLVDTLTNDRYAVNGRTTYKEEFVTAGGVDLASVDPATMQSRLLPGLHFAGEVLDIDGITGGFNFQAAWTTGFIAGKLA